jgi:hypothetical protein
MELLIALVSPAEAEPATRTRAASS